MEVWKDIPGYEGKYQVSNKGRVKSLSRKDAKGQSLPERILKLQDNGRGYKRLLFGRMESERNTLFIIWLLRRLYPIPVIIKLYTISMNPSNNDVKILNGALKVKM